MVLLTSFLLIQAAAVAAPPVVDDQQLIAQAVKILAAGSAKQAFDLLEKPLQSRDPYTKSAAQFFAGHCLLKMNQVPRALDMWASIAKPLRDKPQSAHYFYAAKMEAMQLFVSGKAKWPDRPQPRQVGHIIYRTDQSWRSLPDTIKDILDDPPLEARQAKAALLLGQLAIRDKRPDLAERYYRRGLTILQQFKPPPGFPELLEEKPRLEKELAARLAPYEAPDKLKSQAITKQQEIAAAEKSLSASERQGNELWRQAQAAAEKGQIAAAGQLLRQLVTAPTLADHPRAHEAQYRLGKCLLALNDPTGAFAQWDRAIKSDPAGPYRAQILLDMADQLLFEEYDTPAAEKQLDRMAQIIQGLCPSPTGPPGSRPSENPNESATTAPAAGLAMALEIPPETYAKLPRSWQQPFRSLVYRRSVLAWTKGDLALAVKSLEQSQALPPGPRLADFQDPYFATGERYQRTLDGLRDMDQEKFSLLPVENRRDPRVGTAILLGELFFQAREYERAEPIFTTIAKPKGPMRPSSEQEAFALLRGGQCRFKLFQYDVAQQYYERLLSEARFRATRWAAGALLRRATIEFSVNRNRDSALALMQKICTEYPDSPEAVDASYFTGVIWQWTGQRLKAQQAYEAALARYPDHEGLRLAVSHRFKELGIPTPGK